MGISVPDTFSVPRKLIKNGKTLRGGVVTEVVGGGTPIFEIFYDSI